MSYSHKEASMEQDEAIFNALDTRDSEALYQLASLLKEQGEDENAERLIKVAKTIDEEDNAFDNNRDNQG
jgi:hypothetical protein